MEKIEEKKEPKGWSVNCFQPPDWHSAKSNCARFSMGFRIIKGVSKWEDLKK